MRTVIATFGFLLMAASFAAAQNAEPRYRGQGYLYFGLGTGIGNSYYGPLNSHPAVDQLGFGGEGFLYKGLGFGAEAGHASWGTYYGKAWIGSADFSYHFGRQARRGGVDPFVVGGFSIFGPTSGMGGRGKPGANLGGGLNLWLGKHAALRFEARDHVGGRDYIPGNQYLSFRVGVTLR